ncbi:MAG TPA: STAS domain-containing protein [Bacteroidota bacterium]|nr:STAS domain-containing protein [Bacteroidota bacterium]
MIIEESQVGGVAVFNLTGDFISEPDQITFQQKVRDLVRLGKIRLVVNLRKVHYINSCGIGSLVGALTTLRRSGGEIYLAETSREVRSVFETAQLQLIFHFHSTVNDAVRTVGQPGA